MKERTHEAQEEEAGPRSGRMPAREAFERIVYLVAVAGAHRAREVEPAVPLADVDAAQVGLADGEEVRAQAADEPLDEDL